MLCVLWWLVGVSPFLLVFVGLVFVAASSRKAFQRALLHVRACGCLGSVFHLFVVLFACIHFAFSVHMATHQDAPTHRFGAPPYRRVPCGVCMGSLFSYKTKYELQFWLLTEIFRSQA